MMQHQNGHHMQQHGAMDPAAHQQQMHDVCVRFQLHLVQFETTDGQVFDGIIDSVDQEGVNMLVPTGDMEREGESERQFYGPGYTPYGYGFPRRFRRFRRHRFPFFGLRRLFFPFFY
ncbi:hypothetical protein LGQ02_04660 [Bacillus shivajii]|uniref:hypothetical protein n=1 Tax=Bacillus shivajii TaxID=1983719 RepID=UPI001CFAA885|nr:hypothetical protein [Bacillus shivajii]UCZ54077.1 hypothetical protein LGQ02_04660 [Bacillus shivajii]